MDVLKIADLVSGQLKNVRFYDVVGHVKRDDSTYWRVGSPLNAGMFLNMRMNAAALVSVAATGMPGENYVDDGLENAKRLIGFKRDVLLDSRIMDRFMDELGRGIEWVLSYAGCDWMQRAEGRLVKLAMLARVMAYRTIDYGCNIDPATALKLTVSGDEVGPLVQHDCEVPLCAADWREEAKFPGGVYCITTLGDYSSERSHRTLWWERPQSRAVWAEHRRVLSTFLAGGEEFVFHFDGDMQTHVNMYTDIKSLTSTVARNLGTEVVTSARRYNTDNPVPHLFRDGGIVHASDSVMRLMYLFRALDVLPMRVASRYIECLRDGSKTASGFTLYPVVQWWMKSTNPLAQADVRGCLAAADTLIQHCLGPYAVNISGDGARLRTVCGSGAIKLRFVKGEVFERRDFVPFTKEVAVLPTPSQCMTIDREPEDEAPQPPVEVGEEEEIDVRALLESQPAQVMARLTVRSDLPLLTALFGRLVCPSCQDGMAARLEAEMVLRGSVGTEAFNAWCAENGRDVQGEFAQAVSFFQAAFAVIECHCARQDMIGSFAEPSAFAVARVAGYVRAVGTLPKCIADTRPY